MKWNFIIFMCIFALLIGCSRAEDDLEEEDFGKVDPIIGKTQEGSKTDAEVVQREEEAIKLDGLNVAQMKELRAKAEKHHFQAEVDRMMKLIINSLYKNKEIFLRELISNSSDALDKIRFLSLTDKDVLRDSEELSIRIKVDTENHLLHVIDTGVGMTKDELVKNLGTIAKSGTSDFLTRLQDASSQTEMSDLIGQFGVGFYSSFLVADKVVVTSKSYLEGENQHIWESDTNEFSVVEDPRGNTLGRGTQVTLHLKEEAHDYGELSRIKELIKKYSQFINFNIFLWDSRTETVEEPIDEAEAKPEDTEEEKKSEDDDEGTVEDDQSEKTKKVEKTVWDWVLINDTKPIWTRKSSEVDEKEYEEFYKSFSHDSDGSLGHIHFKAEGEITFTSILYIPKKAPSEHFQQYGKNLDSIKLYVRRVFITDDFEDMMPKYLSFVRGIVDSDDLPLNVSRETLQQHKLLKVIKKKLVRKTLDMIKKLNKEDFTAFWKEFSTSIKLGVIEDHSNRTRLAKLLRFYSSSDATEMISLEDYVSRMKDKQEAIYYIAGQSREEVERSPFVERLLKKGYEVLYLIEAVDEYCVQSLPEFEGKKLQNVAKEGLKIDPDTEVMKERKEQMEKDFKPLIDWLHDKALSGKVWAVKISDRLVGSPMAVVAGQWAWSANMERMQMANTYKKAEDVNTNYYVNQKKTLEINPRHPLIKELKARCESNADDEDALAMAEVMFDASVLRSGFVLKDTSLFADRLERMLRLSLKVPLDEKVEEFPEDLEDLKSVEGDSTDDLGTAEETPSQEDIDNEEGTHVEL